MTGDDQDLTLTTCLVTFFGEPRLKGIESNN